MSFFVLFFGSSRSLYWNRYQIVFDYTVDLAKHIQFPTHPSRCSRDILDKWEDQLFFCLIPHPISDILLHCPKMAEW